MGSGRTLVEGLYSEVGCGAAFRVVLCDGAVWLTLCVVFLVCVILQIGYVRGVATGRALVGEWFESVPSTSLGRGNFSLVLDVSGSYFTGTWWYGGDSTNVAGTWNEPRLSYTRPSNLQCFWTGGYTAGTSCGCALCAWRCVCECPCLIVMLTVVVLCVRASDGCGGSPVGGWWHGVRRMPE